MRDSFKKIIYWVFDWGITTAEMATAMRDRKTITEALVITTEELIMVADEGKPPKNFNIHQMKELQQRKGRQQGKESLQQQKESV